MAAASCIVASTYDTSMSESVGTCQETSQQPIRKTGSEDHVDESADCPWGSDRRQAHVTAGRHFSRGRAVRGATSPPVRGSAHSSPKGGTVCAQQTGVRHLGRGEPGVATRNPSGNRQEPADGTAGGIGSLARRVGMPSRAARRTGGALDPGRSRRKCLRLKVSLLECR
jgi:hypothetical protein